MTSFRSFLALSTLITVAGIGSAQATGVGAGDYSLAVGSSAPCAVTLAADGTAALASTCKVSDYSHWVRTPTGVQFQDSAGNLLAVLKSKGDGYSGLSVVDNHTLYLTPATQTAAH
jgi:hypothetical protein